MNPNHAPKNGRNGIDRWSCNGYGLKLNGKDVKHVPNELDEEPKKDNIDEIVEVEDR